MLFFQCMVLLSVTLSASGACPPMDFMCMCPKWDNGCFVCPCQGQTAQTNGGTSSQGSYIGGLHPGTFPGQGSSGTQQTGSSGSQQSGSGTICKPTPTMCRQITTDAQGCPICVQGGDNSPQSVQNSIKVGSGQNPGTNCSAVDWSCGIHMCLDPVSGCPYCCNGGSNHVSTSTATPSSTLTPPSSPPSSTVTTRPATNDITTSAADRTSSLSLQYQSLTQTKLNTASPTPMLTLAPTKQKLITTLQPTLVPIVSRFVRTLLH